MLEWKDRTSYSRGDKERIPSIWELEVEGLKIVVHKIIHYPEWYLSCYDLHIEKQCLYTEDVEEAKAEGLKIIIEKIEQLKKAKDALISREHTIV